MYAADFSYCKLDLRFFLCKSTFLLCISVFRFFWNRWVFHGEVMEGWEKGTWQPNQEADIVVSPLSLVGVLLNLLADISTHFTALGNNFFNTIWLVSFMDRKSSNNNILVAASHGNLLIGLLECCK